METDILVISNNEFIRQLIQLELSCEGYSILLENDELAGLITARRTQPKLIILDDQTPGLVGTELCNRLRSTSPGLRFLLITDIDSLLGPQSALEKLVDDYIFRPLSINELVLRVRHQMRPLPSEQESVLLQVADISLNLETREVYRGQRLVDLTPKEFDLLTFFLRHPQQVMSQVRILEEVWDYDFMGTSNVLHVYIRTLRNKLEALGESRIIQTVRGIGYVLKTNHSALLSAAN